MKSTMMDVPMTIGMIRRHGTAVHGTAEVVTWTGAVPRRASYADIGRRTAQLAGALRDLGITGDQRVATFQWNNQEHLEAYLAIPSMAAVLHTLNLRLAPGQVAWIANHSEDDVVIVDGSLLPLFARALPDMKTVRHVIIVGEGDPAALDGAGKDLHFYDELLAGRPEEFDWPSDVDERSASAMCYTSGTTGNPKGVAYSHRSTFLHSLAIASADAAALTSHDRILPIVPMFHANAWGLPYVAMMTGSKLLMTDRFLQPEPLCALIAAERPTFAGAVPTIWSEVLRYVHEHGGDLTCIKRVLCGGSAVPLSLMRAYQDELGVEILQAWGMTETSPMCTISATPYGVTDDEEYWRYRTTQGRFIGGVEGRIVEDSGAVLPRDRVAVGEVEVRGPWITDSYVGDADPDRFHDGWLRTGDVGKIDSLGYLTLTDRAKDVIKSGGEWISSVEMENALMGHPQVIEAAVVAIPDEKWQERPLANVVLAEGADASVADLRQHLADSFAAWQLPEKWAFIDEVPKTSVGKFDKKVIRQRYADGELDIIEQR